MRRAMRADARGEPIRERAVVLKSKWRDIESHLGTGKTPGYQIHLQSPGGAPAARHKEDPVRFRRKRWKKFGHKVRAGYPCRRRCAAQSGIGEDRHSIRRHYPCVAVGCTKLRTLSQVRDVVEVRSDNGAWAAAAGSASACDLAHQFGLRERREL